MSQSLTREELVRRAHDWVGTPFAWGQQTKGVSCDCKGWLVGLAAEVGYPLDGLAKFCGYRKVDAVQLRMGLASSLDEKGTRTVRDPADILLLKVGGRPQHLAMYIGEGWMIHSYQGVGRVVLARMGHVWADAVDSIWEWRNVS
jgi:cell wall-associated NlpC family hydrolase